ncbi:MAG: flavin-dependent dehydrogenase [Elainellaceae cyanobacterium]
MADVSERLYIEVPTSNTDAVRSWLQQQFQPSSGHKSSTPDGCTICLSGTHLSGTLTVFVWAVQRTTYLKAFRWGAALPNEAALLSQLEAEIRRAFPNQYPELPEVDLEQQSIFDALASAYPKTVHYFRKMPQGDRDLTRAYWWERRWRDGVRWSETGPKGRSPQAPRQVLSQGRLPDTSEEADRDDALYDIAYVGGALGALHAALMAKLGYRVLLVERLPFGRMNREWNISRDELQTLVDLGLLSAAEVDDLIACEYVDGFHKFFDANNPPQAKAPVLHTPTVLNVALKSDALLARCGEIVRQNGGRIADETEFVRAAVEAQGVTLETTHLPTRTTQRWRSRLLVDAMGTASPIAWQLNGGRAFDSVCPTVGGIVSSGFDEAVWDSHFGDVLNSHGDISRGRQLIWELFPGENGELTIYLFHYHQVDSRNPGSLLEMYEDFFTILPEYRRCDMEALTWRKPTFGYIPGHFSVRASDRQVAYDRLIAIGDAASLQSPLVFTGFGSLVRNLPRLTHLLDVALRHDLLQAHHLNQIRAFQSNVAVTWLFSKGMMVPTGKFTSPERINAMLNTFFGILASEPDSVADDFIKDRAGWGVFNRMALKAAWRNPALIGWIWQLAGPKDFLRWTGSYVNFTVDALLSWLFSWLPHLVARAQPRLEAAAPGVYFWLLVRSYAISYAKGNMTPRWAPEPPPESAPESDSESAPESSVPVPQPAPVGDRASR